MAHAGMVWYIPSRSSLDAWLQARLGELLALVDASVRRLAASGSTGREAWQGQHATKPHASLPWQTQHSQSRARSVGFVPRLASPCLAHAATPSVPWSNLPKLLATLVASGFPGKTRGTPLLDCPCQDSPGAPHRPVLPGWSPLFAGSPRPIPHRGARASLATALARGGKWSLPASPPRLRATLSGCFRLYWEQKSPII